MSKVRKLFALAVISCSMLGMGCTQPLEPRLEPSNAEVKLDRPYKVGTPGEIPIRAKEIAPKAFLVTGRGANTLAVLTDAGWILVDTKLMYPAAYDELKERLVKVGGTDKIHAVFISHHHADHTGGTIFIRDENIPIIGHENAADTLGFYKSKIAPINPAQPSVTFAEQYQMSVGDFQVHARYFGPAHTNGDVVISFPQIKLIAAGDLLYGNGSLAVDMRDGRGSLLGMADRLDDILELEFDILLPGHGDNVLTRAEVVIYRDRLNELVRRGQAAIKNGTKTEGLLEAMRSDDLGFRLKGHFWQDPRFLKPIYDELAESIRRQDEL